MPKIRSLQEAVNALLQQFRVFAQDLSIDEHILGFTRIKLQLSIKI